VLLALAAGTAPFEHRKLRRMALAMRVLAGSARNGACLPERSMTE
jgi:ribosomal protein S7